MFIFLLKSLLLRNFNLKIMKNIIFFLTAAWLNVVLGSCLAQGKDTMKYLRLEEIISSISEVKNRTSGEMFSYF